MLVISESFNVVQTLIHQPNSQHKKDSMFFCLDTKEPKNQGLQNTPAKILTNCQCGRVISGELFQSTTIVFGASRSY